MKSITIASEFVKDILEGAVLKGYNAEEILKVSGIPTEILSNPKLRISTSSFAKLSYSINSLLRDEAGGLLARPQPLGMFNLISQACLSSPTIGDSLQIYKEGLNLSQASFTAYFSESESRANLAIHCKRQKGVTSNYIVETTLSTVHRFHCWLAREFLPIERVELNYPAPKYASEYRFVFYGAPVLFDQAQNAISFHRSSLELPCNRSKIELNALHKAPQLMLLTQPKHSTSTTIRVRLWMERCFQDGNQTPHLDNVAVHLGLSSQTLRRQLKKDGLSFQQLKEETRRDMAIFFIRSKRYSIETIAQHLGYSEASTFIRAFKKWTGLTPLAYRKLE